jgi:tetratricopeptide (TPR) repeat protein
MATKAKTGASSKAKKPAADFKEVDKLLDGAVTRKKVEEASAILDAHLKADPESVDALVRKAKAWIRLMEKETGTVLVEKREYQPILDECGKKALTAAQRAHELDPAHVDAIGWHLVAYGYHSIAIGIVKAFLSGAAGKYLQLAGNLIAAEPDWLSGAGHRAMGRFYREAPWPKRDVRKAVQAFREALEQGPKRVENKLHLALALIDDGKKAEAKPLLQEVVKGKPEAAEAHFHDSIVAFAKEKLAGL